MNATDILTACKSCTPAGGFRAAAEAYNAGNNAGCGFEITEDEMEEMDRIGDEDGIIVLQDGDDLVVVADNTDFDGTYWAVRL